MRIFVSGISLCLALFASMATSAPPANQGEIRHVQEQIQVLDRDVAILKEVTGNRLDEQDKRIDDLGLSIAQQANHMGAIANLSSLVGLGITIIAIIAGFAVYVGAKDRAVAEARGAVQEWFKEHNERHDAQIRSLQEGADALRSHISQLQQKTTDALREIDLRMTEINHHAEAIHQAFDQAAQEILSRAGSKDHASQQPADLATINAVRKVSEALKSKPEKEFTSDDHFARGLDDLLANRFDSALLSFENALESAKTESLLPIRHIWLMFSRAFTLAELGRREEAIAVYDEIDRCYGEEDSLALHEWVAKVLFNKGVALSQLGRNEEAIAAYEEIDRRYCKDESLALRERLATVLFNKGVALAQLGRNEDAIAVYDEIDRRYGKDDSLALREQVATALFNKGVALAQLGPSEDAIVVYDEIDRRFGKHDSPALRERSATVLFNKGIALVQLGRSEDAIVVYDEIDRRYGEDDSLVLRQWVATALISKGLALAQLGRSEDAIVVYTEIDRRYGKDDSFSLRERVATALSARAFTRILQAKQDWEAETERRKLLDLAIGDLECAQRQCAEAERAMVLGNLGYALFLSGKADQAQEPTRGCLRLGGWESLQGQYGDAQRHRVEPLDSQYEKLLDRLWDELHPKI